MSDKNDSGDKTEKPTAKRLRDARKKGDIPKSKDMTSTVGLAAWIVLAAIVTVFVTGHLAGVVESSMKAVQDPGISAIQAIGAEALTVLLVVLAAIAVPVIAVSLLTEFMQVGAVFTFEKIKPKMDHLNPGEGLKRIFSMDNLFELVKSILKTLVLLSIAGLTTFLLFDRILALYLGQPGDVAGVLAQVLGLICAATVAVFIIVSFMDRAYQKFSYEKKMRMSLRDIRQEHKQMEGDPHIKQQRKSLAHEWSQQSSILKAKEAFALIMNPTHIAVALNYDPVDCPVPYIAAKGYDRVARVMRDEAEAAGVPVAESIELARALDARSQANDPVPAELYDAVAEIIVWAQDLKDSTGRDASRHSEEAKD